MAYQKQTWRDFDDTKTDLQNINNGAVVTPERLNHIENGIANSADKAEVTAQLQQTDGRLDTVLVNGTPTEGNTILLDGAVSASGKNLGTVGTNIRKTQTGENILDNAIKGNHTNFLEVGSVNLHNKETTLNNAYINASGILRTDGPYATAFAATDFIPVEAGKQYTCNMPYQPNFAVYDANKVFLKGYETSEIGLPVTIPSGGYYVRWSIEKTPATTIDNFMFVEGTVLPNTYIPYKWKMKSNVYMNEDNLIKTNVAEKPQRMLVFGDSYSQGRRWITQLESMMNFEDIVNLGVSSATIKDRYKDRTAYPYTSRPVSTNNTGNSNTLSSQLAKLKRLMAGVDLDAGEKKIYPSQAEHPDIIIIQGGINDVRDTQEKLDTYFDQLYEKKTNVYVSSYGAAPTLGNAIVKSNIETIDRTSFMGAIRYLYEELHKLFPIAKIYVVTPTGLSYGNGVAMTTYLEKAEQMKRVCSWLSLPVIDWTLNSRLTYLDTNVSSGAGTAENPYKLTSASEYTSDNLHPNDAGAFLLARVAAAVLRQDY